MEFLPESTEDAEPDLETFVDRMKDLKKDIYGEGHENIQKAQRQQKKDYDRKYAQSTVSIPLFNVQLDGAVVRPLF